MGEGGLSSHQPGEKVVQEIHLDGHRHTIDSLSWISGPGQTYVQWYDQNRVFDYLVTCDFLNKYSNDTLL
jgi:hypothetical protein